MNYVYSNTHYVNNKDFLECLKSWQRYKIRKDFIEVLNKKITENKDRVNELNHKLKETQKRITDEKKDKDNISIEKFYQLIEEHQTKLDDCDNKLNELKLDPRENRDYKILYDKVGEIILKLIDHIATKHNYRMYPYLDDMKMLAMEHCIKGLDKFDCEKYNNPFWFFSKSVENAFKQVIIKEKKLLNDKFEYVKRFATDDKMLRYDYNIGSDIGEEINDYINEMENEIMDEHSDVYSNFTKNSTKNDLAP
jgi:hypothetical protein